MPNNIISWDAPENREYEYGVDHGVHYLPDENGIYSKAAAWNGLTNVSDSPSGADTNKLWADGINYATLVNAEEYAVKVEAYTYPDQFAGCDGVKEVAPGVFIGQQERKPFGLCWRTKKGDANNTEKGYKLHLAWNLRAQPSEKSHDTVNDNTDAMSFSWDMDGTPVPVTGAKPTCKMEIDSTKVAAERMAALEKVLYGSETASAKLPTPDEVIALIQPAQEEDPEES